MNMDLSILYPPDNVFLDNVLSDLLGFYIY